MGVERLMVERRRKRSECGVVCCMLEEVKAGMAFVVWQEARAMVKSGHDWFGVAQSGLCQSVPEQATWRLSWSSRRQSGQRRGISNCQSAVCDRLDGRFDLEQ